MTNILVIGSGGREHALIYALKRSKGVGRIYALPGNGGINRDAIGVTGIAVSDHSAIAEFCKENDINFVLIGPEAPLVDGITDYLEDRGIKVFGPSRQAAQLEGSKDFMKGLARRYNIPTAKYESFTDADSAKKYLINKAFPIVVKADGLAAGKGVIIAENESDATKAIDEMFAGRFGEAGNKVVIEEFLQGQEASFFAICDGETAIAFGSAQDHKRVGDGDTGPNTGGMGAYSPASIISEEMQERVMQEIIIPAVEGMKKDGIPYKGFLFAGLMIDKSDIKLLEFNARMGDPETQVLMPLLESDLLSLLMSACDGDLKGKEAKFSNKAALCVVMAAKGYPGEYKKNTTMNNLDEAANLQKVKVFHAGTKFEESDNDGKGQFYSNGGRVLGITAIGDNVKDAQKHAYEAVDMIDWEEGFCRRDIGWRAVEG